MKSQTKTYKTCLKVTFSALISLAMLIVGVGGDCVYFGGIEAYAYKRHEEAPKEDGVALAPGGPGVDPPSGSVTTISEAQNYNLEDDIIEFGEIPSLVETYSTIKKMEDDLIKANTSYLDYPEVSVDNAYQELLDTIDGTIYDLEETRKDATDKATREALTKQIGQLRRLRNAKHTLSGLSEDMAALNAAVVSMHTVEENLDKARERTENAIRGQFYSGKKTAANAMQTLFFSYKSLELTEKLLEQQIKMYEASYDKAVHQRDVGRATDLEVKQALLNIESAKNNLEATQNGLNKMKRTMGTTLGWNISTYQNIVLGELPVFELDYMDSRDLEADIQNAFMQNSEYGSAISIKDPIENNWGRRQITIAGTEQKIRVAMNKLRSDVLTKKEEYEAATTSSEVARLKKERADRMDASGLVSRSDYEGLQLDYINKANAVETARMAYDQAVFNYDQAVYKGIMTLEE